MKKLLIITYYWPPSGGSGVQRWLKFTKYLTRRNYHCIIYTPQNPESPVIDHSISKDIPSDNIEILKTKILEPYSIYRKITGKSSDEKITVAFLNEKSHSSSLLEKFSQFIRGNVFIPDARMLWIKPSIRYLSQYLSINQIDTMISTGPPHSMHLIAYGIKKKYPSIKWIADFRDPWTNIDFINHLYLTKWAKHQHQLLEKKVVQSADIVISVSPTLTNELSVLDKAHPKKFFTITNGYDTEDIPPNLSSSKTHSDIYLTYTGLIPPNRNPVLLWRALAELKEEKQLPDCFKVQLIGKIDMLVWQDIEKYGISNYVEKIDYLSHSEIMIKQSHADAFMLIINQSSNNKGILTGKLFEYLAFQKPIIAIGPIDGDAAQIIKETSAGVVIDYDDVRGMKQSILSLIHKELPAPRIENIQKYSRSVLTDRLIELIEGKINP